MSDYINGISLAYDLITLNRPFSLVDKNEKVIDLNLKQITGSDKNSVWYCADGFLWYTPLVKNSSGVSIYGKWGAVDIKGNVIIDFKYDSYFIYLNGIATVKKSGKFGYIDNKGEEIIKPQYGDANFFNKNVALVGTGGTYFLIDKFGEKVNFKTWKFEGSVVSNLTTDIVSYKQNIEWELIEMTL